MEPFRRYHHAAVPIRMILNRAASTCSKSNSLLAISPPVALTSRTCRVSARKMSRICSAVFSSQPSTACLDGFDCYVCHYSATSTDSIFNRVASCPASIFPPMLKASTTITIKAAPPMPHFTICVLLCVLLPPWSAYWR